MKQKLKQLPFVGRAISAFRYWTGVRNHRRALKSSSRPPLEAFTRFYRNPHQFDALLGPVLEFLTPEALGRPLRIVVLACSTGAEPYSVCSTLLNQRPDISFEILASDINAENVNVCEKGVYREEDVLKNELLPEWFVERTFEKRNDAEGVNYVVRPEIRRRITFATLDALQPDILEKTGKADVLFLQNVLFNLTPDVSAPLFANALKILAEKAVVFLDGMDINQRPILTAEAGLTPLDYEIETIHKEVWRIRKDGWPGLYWGIEPYWPYRNDTLQRYATIYTYEKH